MADYKRMYGLLFNAMTDASREIDNIQMHLTRLNEIIKSTQRICEEIYIQTDSQPITFVRNECTDRADIEKETD